MWASRFSNPTWWSNGLVTIRCNHEPACNHRFTPLAYSLGSKPMVQPCMQVGAQEGACRVRVAYVFQGGVLV